MLVPRQGLPVTKEDPKVVLCARLKLKWDLYTATEQVTWMVIRVREFGECLFSLLMFSFFANVGYPLPFPVLLKRAFLFFHNWMNWSLVTKWEELEKRFLARSKGPRRQIRVQRRGGVGDTERLLRIRSSRVDYRLREAITMPHEWQHCFRCRKKRYLHGLSWKQGAGWICSDDFREREREKCDTWNVSGKEDLKTLPLRMSCWSHLQASTGFLKRFWRKTTGRKDQHDRCAAEA